MAHKALIGGTAYEIKGGRCLVGGTAYDIKKGRALVGGTGYDVKFAAIPVKISTAGWADRNHSVSINGNTYDTNNRTGTETVSAGDVIKFVISSSEDYVGELYINGTIVKTAISMAAVTYNWTVPNGATQIGIQSENILCPRFYVIYS